MITKFALSLSFDSISLLYCSNDGWQVVGSVPTNSPQLDRELANLRALGLAIDDDLATRLIIPDDQIRFMAIETARTTDQDVLQALDGATPYALDDLVIDCARTGGRTHIAAVARETLQEAEAFAAAHGFNPLVFVAEAPVLTFNAEVFFGLTTLAQQHFADADLPRLEAAPRAIGVTPPVTPKDHFEAPQATAAEQPAYALASPHLDLIIPEVHAARPPANTLPLDVSEPLGAPLATVPIEAPMAATVAATPRPALPFPKAEKPVVAAPKFPQAAVNETRRSKAPIVAAALVLAAALVGGLYWWQSTQSVGERIADIAPTEEGQPQAVVVTDLLATPAIDETAPLVTERERTEIATAPPTVLLPTSEADGTPLAEATETAEAPPIDYPAPKPVTVDADFVGQVLSPDEAEERYRRTGVWQRAARIIDQPDSEFSSAVVAPVAQYAPPRLPLVLLPQMARLSTDLAYRDPGLPPAADVEFPRDANGFILATPEGTLTPDGMLIFSGRPLETVPLRPALTAEQLALLEMLAPAPEDVIILPGRPPFATPLRPDGLAQTAVPEPVVAPSDIAPGAVGLAAFETLGTESPIEDIENAGVVEGTLVVSASLRPIARPAGIVPLPDPGTPDITAIIAATEADQFIDPTPRAVDISSRPDPRPSDFGRVVAAAQARLQEAQIAQTASIAAAIASAAELEPEPEPDASPSLAIAPAPSRQGTPEPGDVARAATSEDAITLRQINLIGVYGRSGARRALVRLANGDYQRVQVGSSLDGGQVSAIDATRLLYVKRGTTYALELPNG